MPSVPADTISTVLDMPEGVIYPAEKRGAALESLVASLNEIVEADGAVVDQCRVVKALSRVLWSMPDTVDASGSLFDDGLRVLETQVVLATARRTARAVVDGLARDAHFDLMLAVLRLASTVGQGANRNPVDEETVDENWIMAEYAAMAMAVFNATWRDEEVTPLMDPAKWSIFHQCVVLSSWGMLATRMRPDATQAQSIFDASGLLASCVVTNIRRWEEMRDLTKVDIQPASRGSEGDDETWKPWARAAKSLRLARYTVIDLVLEAKDVRAMVRNPPTRNLEALEAARLINKHILLDKEQYAGRWTFQDKHAAALGRLGKLHTLKNTFASLAGDVIIEKPEWPKEIPAAVLQKRSEMLAKLLNNDDMRRALASVFDADRLLRLDDDGVAEMRQALTFLLNATYFNNSASNVGDSALLDISRLLIDWLENVENGTSWLLGCRSRAVLCLAHIHYRVGMDKLTESALEVVGKACVSAIPFTTSFPDQKRLLNAISQLATASTDLLNTFLKHKVLDTAASWLQVHKNRLLPVAFDLLSSLWDTGVTMNMDLSFRGQDRVTGSDRRVLLDDAEFGQEWNGLFNRAFMVLKDFVCGLPVHDVLSLPIGHAFSVLVTKTSERLRVRAEILFTFHLVDLVEGSVTETGTTREKLCESGEVLLIPPKPGAASYTGYSFLLSEVESRVVQATGKADADVILKQMSVLHRSSGTGRQLLPFPFKDVDLDAPAFRNLRGKCTRDKFQAKLTGTLSGEDRIKPNIEVNIFSAASDFAEVASDDSYYFAVPERLAVQVMAANSNTDKMLSLLQDFSFVTRHMIPHRLLHKASRSPALREFPDVVKKDGVAALRFDGEKLRTRARVESTLPESWSNTEWLYVPKIENGVKDETKSELYMPIPESSSGTWHLTNIESCCNGVAFYHRKELT